MRIAAYPDEVEPNMLMNVKNYILNAARFEYASWPSSSYKCVIWKNGLTITVSAGAVWNFSGSVVYVDSNPEVSVPTWAPVVLKSIAGFYRLNEDPEVSTAIDQMIDALRRKMEEDSSRATAHSLRGRPVRKIALHNRELRELAYYNAAAPGGEEDSAWRDHEGNVHEINEEDTTWTIMEL